MEEELIHWILGWMFLGLLCNRGTSASSIQLTIEGRIERNITACPAEHLVLTCSVDQRHHPRDIAAPGHTALYSDGIIVGRVNSVHLRSTNHLQVEEIFTVKTEKLGMGPSTFVCVYSEDGRNYSSNSLEVNIVNGTEECYYKRQGQHNAENWRIAVAVVTMLSLLVGVSIVTLLAVLFGIVRRRKRHKSVNLQEASVNSNDVPLEELPSQADRTRLCQFVRTFFSQTQVSSLNSTDEHDVPISGYHRDTIHM